MDMEPSRRDLQRRALIWLPVAAAAAATAGLLAAGEAWVPRIGAPPAGPWWWAVVPLSGFTHLGWAHLAANAAAWAVCVVAASRSQLSGASLLRVWAAGWAAGVCAHVAFAAGHLHGASGGICAAAAWVTLRGQGRWRGTAGAVVAAMLLPSPGSSSAAHLAGVVAGVLAAACGRRRTAVTVADT